VIPDALAERVRAAGREFPGAMALFDADGTLWREDAGEAFLRHLVSLGWAQLPDGSDPYEAYERAVDRDRATGYAYAAQLQAGLEVRRGEAEARRFAAAWVPPRMVVSASALPIVVAAAPLAGFAGERCRGIEVIVRDGRFTTEVVRPITYAEGKIAALRESGRIALACGDSLTGDLVMLKTAQVAVVVAPRSGSPLSEEARRRGWAVLDQDSG